MRDNYTVQSASETAETAETVTTATGTRAGDGNEYDILAFFAEFISCFNRLDRAQGAFIRIFLDSRSYVVPQPMGSGASSLVSVIQSSEILDQNLHGCDISPALPNLVAVKIAKLGSVERTSVDRRFLKSMATEMRVLSDSTIRSHANIVTLLGNCWNYGDAGQTVIMPVFTYETTGLGDMETWLEQNKDITLGLQLHLCLGVVNGVVCLNEAGVIHCDLKPKNVLIFREDSAASPVVPKIIDFDIAILHQDAPEFILVPEGTRIWSSPEQMARRSIHRDDLFKIDIFSLGLLLCNLLTSNTLNRFLHYIARQRGYSARRVAHEFQAFKHAGFVIHDASRAIRPYQRPRR